MAILAIIYCLLGFGEVTPLTQDEMITKANVDRAYKLEQQMNSKGMGESWRHSTPQTQSADRQCERNA